MINHLLSKEIEQQVRAMLLEQGLEPEMHFSVKIEHPAHPEHGDYSTNIAMLMAKVIRKSPIQIAVILQQRLEHGCLEVLFAQINVAPPGFLTRSVRLLQASGTIEARKLRSCFFKSAYSNRIRG